MKSLLTLFAAVAFILAAHSNDTSAADAPILLAGNIADADLAQFGLGGMQRVSDNDGLQVRGKFLGGLRIRIVQVNRGLPVVNNVFLPSIWHLPYILR